MNKIREYQEAGIEVEVQLIGKKAISTFRYQQMPYHHTRTDIEDKPTFDQANEIATYYMDSFAREDLDKVELIYTKYFSAAIQKPVDQEILPLSLQDVGSEAKTEASEDYAINVNYAFEPEPESILTALIPRAIRVSFYQALLEAVASEQIARRIAMKSATDNATELADALQLEYNKARQQAITNEMLDIAGAAEAVTGS